MSKLTSNGDRENECFLYMSGGTEADVTGLASVSIASRDKTEASLLD